MSVKGPGRSWTVTTPFQHGIVSCPGRPSWDFTELSGSNLQGCKGQPGQVERRNGLWAGIYSYPEHTLWYHPQLLAPRSVHPNSRTGSRSPHPLAGKDCGLGTEVPFSSGAGSPSEPESSACAATCTPSVSVGISWKPSTVFRDSALVTRWRAWTDDKPTTKYRAASWAQVFQQAGPPCYDPNNPATTALHIALKYKELENQLATKMMPQSLKAFPMFWKSNDMNSISPRCPSYMLIRKCFPRFFRGQSELKMFIKTSPRLLALVSVLRYNEHADCLIIGHDSAVNADVQTTSGIRPTM